MSPLSSTMLTSDTRNSRASACREAVSSGWPSSIRSRASMHWTTSRSLMQSVSSARALAKARSISA